MKRGLLPLGPTERGEQAQRPDVRQANRERALAALQSTFGTLPA